MPLPPASRIDKWGILLLLAIGPSAIVGFPQQRAREKESRPNDGLREIHELTTTSVKAGSLSGRNKITHQHTTGDD